VLKKLKALLGAESTLQAREKIVRALQTEEKQLSELILDRVTAERLLVEAETAVTLGEQSEATAAQRRVDASLGAIQRQARKISGLRSRLAAQAPELEEQRCSLKSAMPSAVDAIKASFADEWGTTIATFGALLGKRAAIEGLIGKLSLADPQPIPYELPDSVAGPWRTIEGIDMALNEVAGWSHAATWPAVDAMGAGPHHAYDPAAVYVITDPHGGAEVGTLVMDGSFVPGMLNHLVQIGYAAPLASLDWQNSLESGRRAAQRVLAEQDQERLQAVHERDARNAIHYDPVKAAAASAEQQRLTNGPKTPVSSGPPIKWGSGPQRKVTEGM
jgi:hypothetical protein